MQRKIMKYWGAIIVTLLLGACAAYDGRGLKPGTDGLEEVRSVMGQPALRWQDADGTLQLAYPRGPMGFHTYMVYLAPDGKLQRIENVLDEQVFARIRPDMAMAQVVRLLGPAQPEWSAYFPRRDELVWEWRYCDAASNAARFSVLFDQSRATVRSTMAMTEAQRGLCERQCSCGR